MLTCIYKRVSWRKTEPTIIKFLKEAFLWLISLGLFANSILLIYQLVTDKPLQIIVPKYESKIASPYAYFFATFEFGVSCSFLFYDISGNKTIDCSNRLNQPIASFNAKTQSFEVDFYTKDDDFSFSSDGISNIFFDFYLTNSSYNSLELTSYLAATFIDHSSGLLNANKMVNDALNKQLTEKNTYVLSPNQRNYVGFKRFKNESLANTPRNVFGAPQPDHENDFFIETRFQTSNYPATTEKLHELFFSSLSVFLLTYEIPIIKEKKTKDLLGIISSFGGAFSLSFFVYHVLFGTNRMRPWGVCQRLCKIRSPIQRKLVKTLGPELPLVRDNVDTEETVSLKDLQKQVNSLELLLREYIIDFSYLAESRKNVTRWENSNVGSK